MIHLETTRLFLRNFLVSDWEALHEMIVEYQNSDLAAYDQPWPVSEEEIQKITAWFASGDTYLAVIMKDTGRFIGFVSLNLEQAPDRKVFNIGYVFVAIYRGKGYATEACQGVLEHAFTTMQADEVISGTAAANAASCKLLTRLGFRKTGETNVSFRNSPDGKPVEFLGFSFSITQREWESSGITDWIGGRYL